MNKKKMPPQRLLGLTFIIAGVLFFIVALVNREDPKVYVPISLLSVAVGAAALLLRRKDST